LGPHGASSTRIAPDVRAAGRSHFAGELSWDLLAEDLRALLDHLGLERAIIGGTSMGSGVALRFALRHPARCSRLILSAPLYPGARHGLDTAVRAALQAMNAVASRAPRERELVDAHDAIARLPHVVTAESGSNPVSLRRTSWGIRRGNPVQNRCAQPVLKRATVAPAFCPLG
jgi:pimeloyl-ACP methyl ester carboxylesterase